MRARAWTAAITAIITIAALAPAATATPENQPVPDLDVAAAWPTGFDAGPGAPGDVAAVARRGAGPPALVRKMRSVLPTLRRMPVGTTVERVPRGSGEACPGVPANGPRARAAVVRSFSISETESLLVQVVAFDRPRQAQRALDTWSRQQARDCRRFSIDELRFQQRRTRPPIIGMGNARRAIRTRIAYADPTVGTFHAATQVTAAYRDGRYLLLASSTGLLRYLGDTPEPNYNRWGASIEYMFDRAGRLPR